jgi:ubiquinone/menaquinone biosynthesis C-methylase UbiE
MADSELKIELRKTWEAAAPGWAKWEQAFSAGLSSVTDAMIDMADVRPAMRVLDLACGAGSQSIRAAQRVGPSGRVVASDISAAMLDHVRRNAAAVGAHNIETLDCAADDLDARQLPFDAAICRMGLMLFPSPLRALEAVQRVLRPSARFAALVFTTPPNNPLMAQPMAILLRRAGKSPLAPGHPGIFALGGEGILENLLTGSGLVDVETRTVQASLELPSASDALQMMQQAFGAYRGVVADLGDAERSRAWEEVGECLKQYESGGRFTASFEFLIGAGAKRIS